MDICMIKKSSAGLQDKETSIDLNKWQELTELIVDLFGADCGAIVKLETGVFNVVVTSQNQHNFLHQDVEWSNDSKSFCRAVVETNKPLYVPNALDNDYWLDSPSVKNGPVRSYCGVPIHYPDGSVYGSICAIDTDCTHYEPNLIKLLLHLSRLITADLKMAQTIERHRQLALTNSMTGLLNRRGLDVLGQQKRKEAKRYHQPIGLLYIDIDKLKLVNDTFGHQAGDMCISILGMILEQSVRESDLIARVGGDEFVVLTLLNEDEETLNTLAGRIREKYHQRTINDPELSISNISIGEHIEPYDSGLSLEEMLSISDALMYQEKDRKK